MFYMTLAVATAAPALAAGAMPGMNMTGMAPAPALALVLATVMSGYAVWTAYRFLPRPAAAVARAATGTAPAGTVRAAPRLAACCQIAMGVAMAFMLIQLL
jgi:hypothetical protein